jgi:hypothetical protein
MQAVTTESNTGEWMTMEPKPCHSALPVRLRMLGAVMACITSLLFLLSPAQAGHQEADIEVDPGTEVIIRRPLGLSLTTGFERRFEADIDDGGKMDEWRIPINVHLGAGLSKQWAVGFHVNYVYNHYNFSGSTGFGGLDPWDNIHQISFSIPLMYRASRYWQFTVVPTLQVSAESGADFGDGLQGGGIVTAMYTVNPRLMLGMGVGASTQIEDGVSFKIFPLLRWQITNRLVLETKRNPLRGGGGNLTYTVSKGWQASLGASTIKRRFRLDDDGIAPDGVGEHSSQPVWASIAYAPSSAFKVELYGGAALGGHVRLEDEDGNRISKDDVDPAPALGLVINGTF